jgi:hypothetical protein
VSFYSIYCLIDSEVFQKELSSYLNDDEILESTAQFIYLLSADPQIIPLLLKKIEDPVGTSLLALLVQSCMTHISREPSTGKRTTASVSILKLLQNLALRSLLPVSVAFDVRLLKAMARWLANISSSEPEFIKKETYCINLFVAIFVLAMKHPAVQLQDIIFPLGFAVDNLLRIDSVISHIATKSILPQNFTDAILY